MLKYNSEYRFHNISIALEDKLAPYWELIMQLVGEKYVEYCNDLVGEEYVNELLQRYMSDDEINENEKKEEITQKVFTRFCENKISEILSLGNLEKNRKALSTVLMLLKLDGAYYILDEISSSESSAKQLTYLFEKASPLYQLLEKSIGEQASNISTVEKRGLYSNIVSEVDARSERLHVCISPIDFMKMDDVELQAVEINDVWINHSVYSRFTGSDHLQGEYRIIAKSEAPLAIKVNDYIIPINQDVESTHLKKSEILYIWWLINHFCSEKNNRTSTKEELSFSQNCKDSRFSKMMDSLKYNLYLQTEPEKPHYEFFDELLLLDDLKRLEGFELFVPDQGDNQIVFGAYQKQKAYGENDYNLAHLIYSNKDSLERGKVDSSNSIEKKRVWTLKPQLAYYVASNFFEDIVDHALRELGRTYIRNVVIVSDNQNKHEFDFVINCDDTIWFVECKTTLTTSMIFEYSEKCKWLKTLFPSAVTSFRFAILGYHGVDELSLLSKNPESITKENGWNSISCNFSVNLSVDSSAKSDVLHCVVNPLYLKLKEDITNILR